MGPRPLFCMLAMAWLLALAAHSAASGSELKMGLDQAVPETPLSESLQLIVVTTLDWDASQGLLQRYQRQSPGDSWQKVGNAVAVGVGHSGLGWGRGEHPEASANPAEPRKREGDGRAPAGIFELPGGFATDPEELPGTSLPIVRTHAGLYCVDDPKSAHYNRITTLEQAGEKDWGSAETMLRDDGLYRWGVVVKHNFCTPKPGAGSCIFLHLRHKDTAVTSGCTAMAPSDLASLMLWLEPAAQPLLVQLPEPVYARMASAWKLP